ncbi:MULTISPECIES: aldo/keto reductase [Marinovum]|uniref:aldo/keto reductase n=1 Tax=Marinovum TaxID=367771 RepID=UPI00237C46E7|nr:aldo/keto reductase [Marinovum sp. PR37]MDD9746388.1 aldo/keto reductase [Marinovum sp. PR37]
MTARPSQTSDSRPLRVVLQCRLSSSRLPAKVLLPLAGMPIAVLAAKRAMRGGHDVVLATSDEASDDLLAREAARHGVPVCRGPLDNVLGRFLIATEDLPDAALCVRLTGDNSFPDGDFIDTLVTLMQAHGLRYAAHGGNRTQLPYGMAAEVFEVGALRAAAAATENPFDLEHVTPWIRRQHAPARMPAFPGLDRDWGHLRATVDTFDDYRRVGAVFADVEDPVNVPWQELVTRLQAQAEAPEFHVLQRPGGPAGLVLGTVQLGLAYGRANTAGLPDDAEAGGIVHDAIRHGVAEIDTARAYGQSETRLGRILARGWASQVRVLTKLDPLAGLTEASPAELIAARVRNSVLSSLLALDLKQLPVLMLHRADHLELAGGAVMSTLEALQAEGRIGALGVSVQAPEELTRVLAEPRISHVQLPCNLLDWRWRELAPRIKARSDLRVHVRSAYLQGLLTPADPARWPAIDGVEAADLVASLTALAADLDRRDCRDLCLAYLRGLPWIDGVVVGVETRAQLADNLALFRRPALSPEEIATVDARLPRVPAALLDPAGWPRAAE